MNRTAANTRLSAVLIAAANDGDLTRIAECFSPDYRDHTAGGSREGRGIVAKDDTVVLRTRASGRQEHPIAA